MKFLISTLLALAVLRSVPQLAMMPRPWRWSGWLLLTAFPVLLFRNETAQYNLEELNRIVTQKTNLESLCTIIVVQELLVMLAGFGFVSRLELEEKPRWRHYAAWLPSLLIPAAALYVLAACYNIWVARDFNLIAGGVASALALAGIGLSEAVRRLWPTPGKQLQVVLNGGMLLLIPAVFLPAAAVAEYSRRIGAEEVSPYPALALLGGTALIAFGVIHGIKLIRKAA